MRLFKYWYFNLQKHGDYNYKCDCVCVGFNNPFSKTNPNANPFFLIRLGKKWQYKIIHFMGFRVSYTKAYINSGDLHNYGFKSSYYL